MGTPALTAAPPDAAARRGATAVTVYALDQLPPFDAAFYNEARSNTHQYFMKASPVRPGDFIEFFAEIDLLGAVSACPGGDCGSSHSDDGARCYPLKIEIYRPGDGALAGWRSPPPNAYSRTHGTA